MTDPGKPPPPSALEFFKSELTALARFTLSELAALWWLIRAPLVGALNIVAALIVLFEEWGWRPLADLLGLIARLRVFARLELWIAALPPYAALLVFALPTTILFPVKLLGLYFLSQGQALAAGGVLIGAKVVSTALVARIFMLTKPALMRIAWFAWAYGKFMPWKEALFARIRASWAWRYGRMVKNAVRLEAKQAWLRWKPTVLGWTDGIRAASRAATRSIKTTAQRILRAFRGRASE